jgi:hypothetical protein
MPASVGIASEFSDEMLADRQSVKQPPLWLPLNKEVAAAE